MALLVGGLVVNGISGAFINIPINIAGAAVERRLGRTVLPHFHAMFSVGAALGTLIAAGLSWGHVAGEVQIVIVLAAATVLRLVTLRTATAVTEALPDDAVPDDASATADAVRAAAGAPAADDVVTAAVADGNDDARRSTTARTPGRAATPRGFRAAIGAWTEPRTLLLGLVLLASSLSEGSAGTWLSIAVTDGFATREAIGAVAYGTFVASMTVVRFLGTGLVDRFGRVTVVRASGVSAFVGLAVFALAPSLATAWIGIVLWGVGAALVDGLGARHALGLITLATVLSMSLAGQLRPRPTPPGKSH